MKHVTQKQLKAAGAASRARSEARAAARTVPFDATARGLLMKTLYDLDARCLWDIVDPELKLELRAYSVGGRFIVVRLSLDTGGWELLTPLCEKLEIDVNLDALRAYAAGRS